VVRVVFADQLDDLRLGRMIDLGDEVVAALRCDRQGVEAVEAANYDFAGGTSGPDGNIQKRLHGKMSSHSVSASAYGAAETNQRIVAD
jgi:hypothetical protein